MVEGNRGNFAGATCPVLVVTVVSWHRVIVIVVDVRAGLVIVIQSQIRMICLYAVVEDRHDDVLAGVTLLPRWAKIHVITVLGSAVLKSDVQSIVLP